MRIRRSQSLRLVLDNTPVSIICSPVGKWHRLVDSNQYEQFWRLPCYRYIKPIRWERRRLAARALTTLALGYIALSKFYFTDVSEPAHISCTRLYLFYSRARTVARETFSRFPGYLCQATLPKRSH